jgi:hypothetical protein
MSQMIRKIVFSFFLVFVEYYAQTIISLYYSKRMHLKLETGSLHVGDQSNDARVIDPSSRIRSDYSFTRYNPYQFFLSVVRGH